MVDNRNTALYWAALYGREEACGLALDGNVRLEFLSEYPGYKVTEASGSNRNTVSYTKDWKDKELGRTAVHEAAINGNWELIELFLKHGWSSDPKDIFRPITDQENTFAFQGMEWKGSEKGKRPRDYAFENGHHEVANKIFTRDLAKVLKIKFSEIDTYVLDAQDIGNILSYLLKEEEKEMEAFLDYENNTTVSRKTLGACLCFSGDKNNSSNNHSNNVDETCRCKRFINNSSSANINNVDDNTCKRCHHPASQHIKLNLNPLKQCFIEIAEKGSHVNFYTETGRNLLILYNQPAIIEQKKELAARNFLQGMRNLISDKEAGPCLPKKIRNRKYRNGTPYIELEKDLQAIQTLTQLPPGAMQKILRCTELNNAVQYIINSEQYHKTRTANVSIKAGEHFSSQIAQFDNYVSSLKKRSASFMMIGSNNSNDENDNNNIAPKTLAEILILFLNNRTDKPPFLIVLDEVINLLRGHFQKLMPKQF